MLPCPNEDDFASISNCTFPEVFNEIVTVSIGFPTDIYIKVFTVINIRICRIKYTFKFYNIKKDNTNKYLKQT